MPPLTDTARRIKPHLPILILLLVLSVYALPTLHVFLVSDDIVWLRRTVADSHRPWNAFVEPLFGEYYRPMPHLLWLTNYYLWGFHFAGHQVMFLLLWLTGVWLVYALGNRWSDRTGGLIAAAIVGFSSIYLLICSWKSWYTTLTEFVAVLAWAWFYAGWLKERKARQLCGAVLFGIAAILSRELAPLIISGSVLVTLVLPGFRQQTRRRAWTACLIWLALTLAVVLALPSYRASLGELLRGAAPSASGAGATASLRETVLDRFRSHTHWLFQADLWWLFFLTALILAVSRPRPRASRLPLALAVAGTALVALVFALRVPSPSLFMFSQQLLTPFCALCFLGLFLFLAFRGDLWDRMAAAWFVAAFAPILVLEHRSNAYHLLALTALALFTGRTIARFMAERRDPAQAHPAARFLLGVLLFGAIQQGVLSVANVWLQHSQIERRAAAGRLAAGEVERAVDGMLKSSAPDRRVWVAGDSHAWIAALALQERHGFTVESMEQLGPDWLGLRAFDSHLRVYSDVIRYDPALLDRLNLLPPSMRGGGRVISLSGAPQNRRRFVAGAAMSVPDGAYLFGGEMRREGAQGASVHMTLRSSDDRYAWRTLDVEGDAWQMEWAIGVAPPDGRLTLRLIEAEGLTDGAAYARNVFLCPVAPLIEEARRPGERGTEGGKSDRLSD